tara:strand:+ start:194 stop:2086 length:1893 start_codon:yes stop_codon:yes gene_type:complete
MPNEAYNNNPEWFTDYGDAPTSSPTTASEVIYDSGYDPELVQEDFGDSFDPYDPRREQFAQDRLLNQQKAATLQYDQAEGQAEREKALIQEQTGAGGFLQQALTRQQESLGLQRGEAESAQQRLEGYFDPGAPGEQGRMVKGARQIAGEQVGIQRGLTESEMGFADRDLATAGGRLDLQQQNIEASADQQTDALTDQLTALGLDRSEAERQAGTQTAGVGRAEERLTLEQQQARGQSQFELDSLGRQRQTQDLERGLAQSEISQGIAGARRGLMDAYQSDDAQAVSGFAGSGARDRTQQRAIQAYAGDAAAGIENLRVRAGRFNISEQELKAQEQNEKDKLQTQLDQYDISATELAGRREDIQGGLNAQTQKYDVNIAATQRGIGDVASTEARQLKGVDLSRDSQQTSYDRQISQLGGQMSGYDLQDASNKLRFDEQAGRLESQIAQIGISGRGAQASFNETTGRYESQLEGIDKQLGDKGFLQRGLQNTLGGMGGRFSEEVFGLREQYGDETRDRILDLINDEGLGDEYKLGADLFGPTTGVDSTMGTNNFVATDNNVADEEEDYYSSDDAFGESGRFLAEKTNVNLTATQKQSALAEAGISQDKINELMALPNFGELNVRELIYMTQG